MKSYLKVNAQIALFCQDIDGNGVFSGCAGHSGVGTDHDKLMARLETDLKQSQQLVRLQQQLLQV